MRSFSVETLRNIILYTRILPRNSAVPRWPVAPPSHLPLFPWLWKVWLLLTILLICLSTPPLWNMTAWILTTSLLLSSPLSSRRWKIFLETNLRVFFFCHIRSRSCAADCCCCSSVCCIPGALQTVAPRLFVFNITSMKRRSILHKSFFFYLRPSHFL